MPERDPLAIDNGALEIGVAPGWAAIQWQFYGAPLGGPVAIDAGGSEPRYVVLAVNFQEPAETVASFVEQQGLTFPIVLDERAAVNALYRVRAYPTNIIIKPDGTISEISGLGGATSLAGLNRYLDRALR